MSSDTEPAFILATTLRDTEIRSWFPDKDYDIKTFPVDFLNPRQLSLSQRWIREGPRDIDNEENENVTFRVPSVGLNVVIDLTQNRLASTPA